MFDSIVYHIEPYNYNTNTVHVALQTNFILKGTKLNEQIMYIKHTAVINNEAKQKKKTD